ncbi:MAG: glycosyltransferase family 39 protein [Flavobacteriales bacterium]|nr:glycosyltransferase family 39 protein [Flavobacteriales bacterium]MCC6939168.1 glycosyltransferase family 39 protein [Flavobacteriales bacterium]
MNLTSPLLRSGLALLLLVAVAFALHLPVLGLSFFSDDFSVLHRIGEKRDLGTGSFFRPLPDWTLYINYLVSGPSPIAFRSINVLLLGFNAWLVFLLGRNLFGDDALRSPAFIGALLFVCYPFHNEPQLWIIGRSTAMATSFTLLALIAATSHSDPITRCLVVGISGALGAMCYELALLLPLMLVPLAVLASHNERRVRWTMVVLAAAVAGSNLLLRSMLTGHVANTYGASFFREGVVSYLDRTGKVIGRLFLPPNHDPSQQVWLFAALASALALTVFLLIRRTANEPGNRKLMLVLTAITGLACGVAIIGGVSTRTSESDRFLYLPSAILCLLIALVVFTLLRGWMRVTVLVVLLVGSVIAMRMNHLNWIEASRTIERIVQSTPIPPADGRLLVVGLPSDHHGAFILRHGYREALTFAGKDASAIHAVEAVPPSHVDDAVINVLNTEDREDTLHVTANDRLLIWTAKGFVQVPR